MRSMKAGLLAAAVMTAGLVPPLVGSGSASAAVAVDPASIGATVSTAAASCWEIKQALPSAADGSYWLQTPAMLQPAEHYCDMTTDGGGWVLVGKGRDGWTTDYSGKASARSLTTATTVPMGPATVQLGSRAVDQLLNGGRVDALAEGVRVRRAMNAAGSQWQEARLRFASKKGWSWTFGAEHALAGWSFDSSTGSGGTTASYGADQSFRRMVNTTNANKSYRLGFGYGTSVAGQNNSSTYLWSAVDGRGEALPYAQVYLRPRILSTDPGYRAIPDSGSAPITQGKALQSDAVVTPWGVSGLAGTTSTEGDVEVQAFTQSGRYMYVGGNFRYVQQDAAGLNRVAQPFLAAFDVQTGEWLPSFRPALNEQVGALETLPDGTVLAGGLFSAANGKPSAAVVALDPVTGATRPGWNLKLENRLTAGVLRVRSIDLQGPWVYIGGALTHMSGGSNPNRSVYTRSMGRVAVSDGTPATDWNPGLNGTVLDVDAAADGRRAYASGFFSTSKGSAAPNVAALETTGGAPLSTPTWTPTWSRPTGKTYQRSIRELGTKVYVGGSEHSLFGFDTSTFARLSGSIMKKHGDVQAIATDGSTVYAGCHCSNWSYTNAYRWPTLDAGWTEASAISWFAGWDAATGERVPDFTPNLRMRTGSGIWAIEVDSGGQVWAGGDIETVRTTAGQRFSGGFARFAQSDVTAPGTPTSFRMTGETASTVSLAWTGTDDPSGVGYQVLRDDRTVGFTNATSITVPRGGSGRFFVRAVDDAGNAGASTNVLVADGSGPNTPPNASFTAAVTNRSVAFDATSSSDAEGPLTGYAWDLGDGSTGSGASASHVYAADGAYSVTLTVTDSAGATATTTRTVVAGEPVQDTQVIANGSSWSWSYPSEPPAADWNQVTAAPAGWQSGDAVLGFGASAVRTDIDSFADALDRPRAAYFTRTFVVPDASRVVALRLRSVADDGVVLYVNGTEVARGNMPDGEITHTTYASSARSQSVANEDPVLVDVPVSLLRSGTNVVSAETHLNYRRTRDLTFDLVATLSTR